MTEQVDHEGVQDVVVQDPSGWRKLTMVHNLEHGESLQAGTHLWPCSEVVDVQSHSGPNHSEHRWEGRSLGQQAATSN